MGRKLIKQGGGGYTIYLPKKWIDTRGLKEGQEINVEETDLGLLIGGGKSSTKLETTIRLVGLTESLIRTLITNTYRRGYDKIHVELENSSQFKILSKVVENNLIGFEITKHSGSSCIVENVTEPSGEQFDAIFDKIFLNTAELLETTRIRFFERKKPEEDFEIIEQRILQYDNFCRRIMIKKRFDKNAAFLWAFLVLFTHAQRELYHLNKNLKPGIKINRNAIDLLEGIKNLFELIQKAYKNNDISLLKHIHEYEKEIVYRKGYSLLVRAKGQEAILIFHLLACIRNLYQSNSPLAAILI